MGTSQLRAALPKRFRSQSETRRAHSDRVPCPHGTAAASTVASSSEPRHSIYGDKGESRCRQGHAVQELSLSSDSSMHLSQLCLELWAGFALARVPVSLRVQSALRANLSQAAGPGLKGPAPASPAEPPRPGAQGSPAAPSGGRGKH